MVALPFCGLDDRAGEMLGQWLGTDPPAVKLNVSHNRLGVQTALILSYALQYNSTVYDLDLSFNPLTTQGVAFFIDVFRLRTIMVNNGEEGAPATALHDLRLTNAMNSGDEQWVSVTHF